MGYSISVTRCSNDSESPDGGATDVVVHRLGGHGDPLSNLHLHCCTYFRSALPISKEIGRAESLEKHSKSLIWWCHLGGALGPLADMSGHVMGGHRRTMADIGGHGRTSADMGGHLSGSLEWVT